MNFEKLLEKIASLEKRIEQLENKPKKPKNIYLLIPNTTTLIDLPMLYKGGVLKRCDITIMLV